MNIRKYRSFFRVDIIDSNSSRRQILTDILSAVGYRLSQYGALDQAEAQWPNDPPHFMIIDGQWLTADSLKKIRDICLETHVVVVAERGEEKTFYSLMPRGLYDVLPWPLIDSIQLISAIDRGAERDYFQYQNEQLTERLQILRQDSSIEAKEDVSGETEAGEENSPAPWTSSQLDDLTSIMLKIGQATTIREAVQIFLQAGFDLLQQPTFFFKYLFARQALFLAQGVGFQVEKYSQLGIEFSANNTVHFNSKSLAHPEELNALRELMNSAFGIEQFSAFPLAHGDSIRGVVLIAGSSSSENMKFLSPLLSVLNLRYENLLLQGRLHDLETFDEVTQVWNRDNFDRRLQEEMARSRRTQLPISLARISVDRFGEIKRNSGQERTDLLLRAIASIIKKNSRINDIVGRLGEDELGLLLPHTRDRGAAIKAERLRRMIESADFSKILPDKTEVTISLGVSEYPSHCRDSEELYQSSDEALFQIKRDGFNQVCLSATPPHFVPDFDVPEK